MFFADSCTLMASSFQLRKLMLRMITLLLPLTFSPQPAIVAPALPMIVLFERTRIMPEQEIVPDTRMTAAELEPAAVVSAEALVTVVVAALPPPVVPPFWVAQPTRSSTPSVRGWLGRVGGVQPGDATGQKQRERHHRGASDPSANSVGHCVFLLAIDASAFAGREIRRQTGGGRLNSGSHPGQHRRT